MPGDLIGMLRRGEYEAPERAIVRRIVKPDDRVLEGGGGLGLVSMVLASIVGPENLLVYEASPSALSLLEENFRANGITATVRNRVLMDRAGAITFHVHDSLLSSSTIERTRTQAVEVEGDDVASVIEEFRPTVIVLDVEGAEIEVVHRAPLDGIRALIIELHPHIVGDASLTPLYRRMFDAGFVLNHDNCWGRVAVFVRPDGSPLRDGETAN